MLLKLLWSQVQVHQVAWLPQSIIAWEYCIHCFALSACITTIDISWGHWVIRRCINICRLNHLLRSSTLLRRLATPSIRGLFCLSTPTERASFLLPVWPNLIWESDVLILKRLQTLVYCLQLLAKFMFDVKTMTFDINLKLDLWD